MQATVVISRSNESPEIAAMEDRLARLCASEQGITVLVIPHIYHIPETDPIREKLASLEDHVILITALHPRPAEWLLRKHWTGQTLTALNISTYKSAESCFAAILATCEERTCRIQVPSPNPQPPTPPFPARWYPVIDRDRCVDCGNCLQFCLFGVYEWAEGEVAVRKPDSCKAGCPACSRICPKGAIIFPLYTQSPAIAGAPGMYMSPDAAARRMFYARTKQACPVCGSTEEDKVEAPGAEVCAECGRAATPSKHEPGLRDEIDQLIDDLDGLMGGK